MQRSTAFTRKTRPARAARNFDGTVSRFFASSVCSKVPWNAKAHAVWSGREWRSRTGVAEWEEPRHHGPAVRNAFYPTFSHSATHFSYLTPLFLDFGSYSDKKGGFAGISPVGQPWRPGLGGCTTVCSGESWAASCGGRPCGGAAKGHGGRLPHGGLVRCE